jgi:carbonic anhydrase
LPLEIVARHRDRCSGINTNQCSTVTCAAWAYEGSTGPANWGTLPGYGTCGTGTHQSPINIVTQAATRVNLGDIHFTEAYRHKIFGSYTNTGETAKFTPSNPELLNITGGPLGSNVYQLAQFHFHWGCEDSKGSEHTIDGKSYSMEMHMVHWKTSYGNFSNAASSGNADALAVLGVLFKADDDNHEYDPLEDGTETLECVAQPNSAYGGVVNLGRFMKTVDPGHYFTYPGSLTTPPCTEAVIWTVFPRIITINNDQLKSFRQLKTCTCSEECDTFRPTQALETRVVRYSKSSSSSSEEHP